MSHPVNRGTLMTRLSSFLILMVFLSVAEASPPVYVRNGSASYDAGPGRNLLALRILKFENLHGMKVAYPKSPVCAAAGQLDFLKLENKLPGIAAGCMKDERSLGQLNNLEDDLHWAAMIHMGDGVSIGVKNIIGDRTGTGLNLHSHSTGNSTKFPIVTLAGDVKEAELCVYVESNRSDLKCDPRSISSEGKKSSFLLRPSIIFSEVNLVLESYLLKEISKEKAAQKLHGLHYKDGDKILDILSKDGRKCTHKILKEFKMELKTEGGKNHGTLMGVIDICPSDVRDYRENRDWAAEAEIKKNYEKSVWKEYDKLLNRMK
jgi:hypothetical protein